MTHPIRRKLARLEARRLRRVRREAEMLCTTAQRAQFAADRASIARLNARAHGK